MVGIGAFRVFMWTRLNIEPYSQQKPIKVGYIFIGSNSLSRAEDLAAVNQSWVEDWVLKSDQSEVFKSRAQVLQS